ncbi:MAG: nucleoside phosphorylase [Bacteroidota bacterium]
MGLSESELILHPDGSIYHLHLLPGDISDTIITVGDPERVSEVSQYFDYIELKKGKREFITHTGSLNGKRLTVMSTGIGTDNIDIVLNELDALANVDFDTGESRENRIRYKIIRLGTSGSIQADIPLDSLLLSEFAVGLDGLLHFYKSSKILETPMGQSLLEHLQWTPPFVPPYVVKCDGELLQKLGENRIRLGVTATNMGFYGPQGRQLRLPPRFDDLIPKLNSFSYNKRRITNLEMETAGLYGMARLMGHKALSLNCILANRITGEFSKNPKRAVNQMIRFALDRLVQV